MSDTREEYEPLSFGVSALSPATTRKRESSRPSTSAAICASSVDEPWPMSAAPVSRVIEPSKSRRRLTVACGSPVQCTGFAAPEMKCEQPTPRPRPRGSLPLRLRQPEASSTQSRHLPSA
jgi:hypothetical protein